MALDIQNTTLICPKNDLEGVTIIEIARKLEMDVRVSEQKWGAELSNEPSANLANLKKNVVIVEIPGEETENSLRDNGHNVITVDHHLSKTGGKIIDRSHSLSSLEQFARLVGHELSPEQWLVALNDRAHIYGMLLHSEADIGDIRRIREKDLHYQGYTEDLFRQSRSDWEKRLELNHLTIVFTELHKTTYIADLQQIPDNAVLSELRKDPESKLPRLLANTKDILIVTVTKLNNPQPIELNFYGRIENIRSIDQVIDTNHRDYVSWRSADRPDNGYFGAKHRVKDSPVPNLLNRVLEALLGPGRPYLRFSTVFCYPFKFSGDFGECADGFWREQPFLESSKQSEGDWKRSRQRSYQEYTYFHPHIRDILFGGSQDDAYTRTSVRYYATPELEPTESVLEIEFGSGKEDGKVRKLGIPVVHVALHRYYNDLGILVIQVCHETTDHILFEEQCEDKNKWMAVERGAELWRLLYQRYARHTNINLQEIARAGKFEPVSEICFSEDVLTFNLLARIIYWSYTQQKEEGTWGRIPDNIKLRLGFRYEKRHNFEINQRFDRPPSWENDDAGGEPTQIIKELLEKFQGLKGDFRGILDDRMYVYSFLNPAGDTPQTNIPSQLDDYRILLSRYLYVDDSGYGYAYNPAFINKELERATYHRWSHWGTTYGFTRYSSVTLKYGSGAPYLYDHFSSVYYQLMLTALHYRCTLLDFSARLKTATEHMINGTKCDENFADLRTEFVKFTNIYWFEELTNQDQGIEMFNHYKRAFEFDKLYREIRDEIERADGYRNQQIENIRTKQTNIIGIIVALISLMAIGYSFMSMPFEALNGIRGNTVAFLIIFYLSIVLAGFCGILIGWTVLLQRRKNKLFKPS